MIEALVGTPHLAPTLTGVVLGEGAGCNQEPCQQLARLHASHAPSDRRCVKAPDRHGGHAAAQNISNEFSFRIIFCVNAHIGMRHSSSFEFKFALQKYAPSWLKGEPIISKFEMSHYRSFDRNSEKVFCCFEQTVCKRGGTRGAGRQVLGGCGGWGVERFSIESTIPGEVNVITLAKM